MENNPFDFEQESAPPVIRRRPRRSGNSNTPVWCIFFLLLAVVVCYGGYKAKRWYDYKYGVEAEIDRMYEERGVPREYVPPDYYEYRAKKAE